MNRRSLIGAVAACAVLVASSASAQQKTITVWFGKGFYKAEDDALLDVIKKFEAKTGIKVELSQYAIQDMIPKTVAALDSGTVPDVAYSDSYDVQAGGKWAFEGKLEDLGDILLPMKDRFRAEHARDGVPLQRSDQEKGLLRLSAEAANDARADLEGSAREIRLQDGGHSKGLERLLVVLVRQGATGFPQGDRHARLRHRQPDGVESTDSFQSFYTFMDAYNVKLVDDDGKLLTDDPKVKEALVNALRDYTDIYTRGCTPPSSTTWKDPDNNVAFHNKTTVMTHNFTISIAAKWFEDSNNPALTPEQRAAGKKAYEEDIVTAAFPNKPDGSAIKYRSDVKTGVVFTAAKNKAEGKEFIKFLMEEQNIRPYIEGALGRWFPVMSESQKSPFWQADRHRKAVYNQFMGGTSSFDFTKNWKFTILNNENVWARAMNRVVSEKVPVEKAVDELLARLKEVAG